jgi:hypothetical protein
MNILANRIPRNRLIPNHLPLNHLLCKFSLWPPHNNPLTPPSAAKGGWQGEGVKKKRINGERMTSNSRDRAVSPQAFTGAKTVCVVFPQGKPL